MDDATTRISSGAFCKTYGIKKKDTIKFAIVQVRSSESMRTKTIYLLI